MAMTDRFEFEDTDLERFFRAARTAAPEPPAAFLTRLAAQAEAVQAETVPAKAVPARAARPRLGLVSALAAAFGGWAALGGMATATVAGLWIGLAGAPTLVQAVGLGSTVSAEADSYLPDADVLALAVMQ
ncbi:hypothetical protein LY44_03257 [Rhodobacter capsulatus]|nr:hypothetical protein AP073_10710 [Rhodobacter capsulatus]KQB16995.1 hypothetical protein AP071_10535 [Rhodobacter capsulatus]PZX21907.1 hypothetical protein LY44_03257 [Rhodobacter capsulatus]